MKNGYYLSAYISVGQLAHLYRLPLRHDQNISLWKKEDHRVMLVHVWELERYSGEKHHNISFYDVQTAKETINLLLFEYGLTIDDMIEIWGCPELQEHKYPSYSFPIHNLAHLYSGFLCDTDLFHNHCILSFAVDGGPDTVLENSYRCSYHYTGCFSKFGKIEAIEQVESPGVLWEEAKNLFHLPEGTLMALASASISKLNENYFPSFSINNMKATENAREYINDLYKICKQARPGTEFNEYDSQFTVSENIISMVMKVVNAYSEFLMSKNIDRFVEKYRIDPKQTYLSVTGGFALNCPTNSFLISKYGFKGFIAPPSVSDTGISIGLALYHFFQADPSMKFKLDSAYYGSADLLDENFIDIYKHYIEEISYDTTYDTMAQDIIEKPVVWFDGRAEIGPRALGHRSILGNPCKAETKDRLNQVKQREWWRPVAPIVLTEYMHEWFDETYDSPYMLHIFTIKEEQRGQIPAISHIDYSSRVQTVSNADDERLYKLLHAFYSKTGVPIICNTSLNDKGEPIINTVAEAINFALRKGFEILYINGCRIVLRNHDQFAEKKPATRQLAYLTKEFENAQAKKMVLNPHQIGIDELCFFYDYHSILVNTDLTRLDDIKMLKKLKQRIEKIYRN